MGVLWIFCFFQLVGFSLGVDVVAPQSLRKHVHSPFFCEFVGPREVDSQAWSNLTFALAYATQTVCSTATAASLGGKVVILDNDASSLSLSMQDEHRLAKCVQSAGGVAVWRAVNDVEDAGLTIFFREGTYKNVVTIPVLTSLQSDISGVIEAVKNGEQVMVELTFDKNLWREMFKSQAWFWFWRVFMAGWNCCGALVALRAIQLHRTRAKQGQTSTTAQRQRSPHARQTVVAEAGKITNTNTAMRLGCVVELCAFVLRAVYFACGPFCSTPTLIFPVQMLLAGISLPLEIATTLISAYLFVSWGALGQTVKRLRRIGRVLLFVTSALCLALQVTLSIFQGFYVTDANLVALLIANFGLVLVISIVSMGVFVWFGHTFIKQLGARVGVVTAMQDERKRKLNKATRWIMVSSLAQLVLVVGVGLASDVGFLLSVPGFFVCVAIVYAGATGLGFAHALAFQPLSPQGSLVAAVAQWVHRASVLVGGAKRLPTDSLSENSSPPFAHL